MSMQKCAKCEKTVYPVEEFKCLDKIWHKTCFKCAECGMILNMKSYKGFDKQPYCNAHCPQAKATIVADTPEARRLAENTKIQSNIQYHADFEKQKGKLTQVADDPETLRLRSTSKIQSQAAYHGDYEKKKQMEEIRSRADDPPAPVPVAVLPTNAKQPPTQQYQPPQHQQHHQQSQPTMNNNVNKNISAASVGHSLHQTATSHTQQQNYQPKNIPDNVKNSPNKMGGTPLYYDQAAPQSHPSMSMSSSRPVGQPQQPPASSMSATARLYPNQVPPNPVQQQYHQQQQYQQQQQQLRQQQLQQQQAAAAAAANMNMYSSHPAQQANYYHPGAQQAALHQQQIKQMSPAHHQQSPHHMPAQSQPPPSHQSPMHANLGRCFRAIYDYTAQDVDEVTFMDGDLIINCKAIDDGWMTGTVQRTGKTGMLPSNYVETA